MSFPRYPEYKDSGVEWLGEVPGHWRAVPIKHLGRLKGGAGFPHEKQGIQGEELSFHKVNALAQANSDGFLIESENTIDRVTAKELGAFIFPAGSIVFAKVGAALLLGRIRLLSQNSCLDNNMMGLVIKQDEFAVKFVLYAMNLVRFDLIANPGAVPSLNEGQIGDFRLAMPPLPEQTQIAAFLDRETAKIDALVAEQRRLMALLKEKRQAVISHAVTRGLNPHAPLKPSGIEWLGDVPEHWAVTPLKYVVSLRSGGTPSKTNTAYWDGDVPWASSKDLKVEMLSDTQDHITQKAVDDGAADLVPAGSLLIVVRGMILIHTFPVVKALVPMAINQDLKALTPSAKLDVDFLAWLLRGASKETLGRIDEAAHGTKVLRLEAWTSIALPIPPIDEQLAIVRAICESMRQFDTLTTEAQRAIDLLQERRTALISAAVTGQIDVRGAV
ncbi:MAG: restriction endonuclease subunit S [Burkholderiaceae bacterium]|nr:restriction endonuclease subunit S [Burkholderiaceae bacterium]